MNRRGPIGDTQTSRYSSDVTRDPELAAWLVRQRQTIEQRVLLRMGSTAPNPAAPESEVLRRFRSFAASALLRGRAVEPSLDGLRADEGRVSDLLGAWSEAAADVAGRRAEDVRDALAPLLTRFRAALRSTTPARQKSGAPKTARRAVMAAIDRIADAFLAVDALSGRIVDANPAAGALLGTTRDALLQTELSVFVPAAARDRWQLELDAVCEGSEPRRFEAPLRDAAGLELGVDARATRHVSRERVLALILARPR
jgi:PAS domain-containing protein